MPAQQVKIVASFEVLDFQAFETFANAAAAYCKQNEPDTLVYDWYIDLQHRQGRLIEVYADTEAFRQHVTGGVFTDIAPKYRKAIRWLSMEAFGNMPEEFAPVMEAVPSTHWPQPIASV